MVKQEYPKGGYKTMNLLDMLEVAVQNNPGAMNAMGNLMIAKKHVDPKAFGQSVFPLFNAIETGFTGSKLWGLFSDLCQKNVVDVYVCWRAVQLDIIPQAELHRTVDNNRNGNPAFLENLRMALRVKHPDLLNMDYEHKYVAGIQAMAEGMELVAQEFAEFEEQKETKKETSLKELQTHAAKNADLHQRLPQGTTEEIASKLGISKKEVRRRKANGTLAELLQQAS